jgi:hypothetical protein
MPKQRYRDLAGNDHVFDSRRAHRYKADNGEREPHLIVAVWSPTVCRLEDELRWLRRDAFDGPWREITLSEAADFFDAHSPRLYIAPGQTDKWEHSVGLPDLLVSDLEGSDLPAMAPPLRVAESPLRRTGRPADTDTAQDRRIAEAWRTGHHKTYKDLADALGKDDLEVKQAIDRHRKRAGITRPRNPRQAP